MPITRLSLDGYGARRAGDFSGKEAAVDATTQSIHVYVEHFAAGRRYWFVWSADADGAVESDDVHIRGTLDRLVTKPRTSPAPTDNYDVTLETVGDGEDVLQGLAANRDTASSETAWIYRGTTTNDAHRVTVNGLFRFNVANAGDGGAGAACLYVLD